MLKSILACIFLQQLLQNRYIHSGNGAIASIHIAKKCEEQLKSSHVEFVATIPKKPQKFEFSDFLNEGSYKDICFQNP